MWRENFMKHFKMGLAAALALVASCGIVGSASATTIEPANTHATLVSTQYVLTLDPEGVSVQCASSTMTVTTGALTHTASASATIDTVTYTGCTGLIGTLAATVRPSEGCHTPAGRLVLHGMTVASTSAISITVPATCSIDISVPTVGCTLTITGGQTIGDGTAGAGGIDWTNRSPKSGFDLNNTSIPRVDSNGVGFACPAAGNHTGTLVGSYALMSATNLTITG
jgi:hypothetical protein